MTAFPKSKMTKMTMTTLTTNMYYPRKSGMVFRMND